MGYGFAQTKNRLLEAANGMTKLEFGYDYLGRRLTKKVWQGETLTQSLKFVYDNYKLIAVLDALADDAVWMTFVWQPAGLDVPLMMTYDSERYFYVTDGNKNVIALYDIDGILMASYSYGPFGQLLSSEGPLAQINPFRFSSEYFDDETDLVYYNYRYYSPRLGRWLSRDPIGEDGGLNLYAMCNNNVISCVDYLGQKPYDVDSLPYLIIIASNQGWTQLVRLLAKWFLGPMHQITNGNDVPLNAPYDDQIITMAWVLTFPRAKAVYNNYENRKGFVTPNFKDLLRKKFPNKGNTPIRFGDEAFATNNPLVRHQHQWQSFNVGGGLMDALDAALHLFTLEGIFAGTYYPSEKKVCIEKVGVYVKDPFNFPGDQYLGNWTYPDSVIYRPYVSSWYDGEVTNKTFRDYQEKYRQGQDFFVFSDVKIIKFNPSVVVNL